MIGHEVNESSFSGEYKISRYTYADYLTWPGDQPIELIEGVAYAMTPAPSRVHQKIIVELSRQISNYLIGKPCEIYSAPFDVRLTHSDAMDGEIENVVQPDIVIICDKEKLDDRGSKGSPDLVMEVVSPTSISMDYIKKLNLYEKYSVREYWIIHPVDKIIMVYQLEEAGKYSRPSIYPISEMIKIGIFADLMISLERLVEEL